MTSSDLLIGKLLPLLRHFCTGTYGIALGGSRAKGTSDALSDTDIYLFAPQVQPGSTRSELVVSALGEGSEVVSWGSDDPFLEGGTDFLFEGSRVECWLRNVGQVESTIASCEQGQIQREYVAWTVMGFFNYVVLADLQSMQIVDDPQGVLARWQAQVREYPEVLRQAILRRFTREAAFWPDNFHYRSAQERADIIYTSGVVQQVLHALVQVVFALNRAFFPGEKRLVHALTKLPIQPADFPLRLQALLTPGKNLGVVQLQEQRRDLKTLVTETEQLVMIHGGHA